MRDNENTVIDVAGIDMDSREGVVEAIQMLQAGQQVLMSALIAEDTTEEEGA